MKMAIIAAGKGERLVSGGISTPKPLVSIGGRPLIARIIDAGTILGMSSVSCIVNDLNPQVEEFLRKSPWPIPLDMVVKTTPNSMESLFCLAPLLLDEPFLLFTVDVVFHVQTIRDFLEKAKAMSGLQGALALTDHVDDEKPLWVAIDASHRITAMGDGAKGSGYITSGFYYFSPGIFAMIEEARRRNLSALRQFLCLLVDAGAPLYGLRVSKTLDVDYPEDIGKAEAFLRSTEAA